MIKNRTSNKIFEQLLLIDALVKKPVYKIINVVIIRSLMMVICAFQLYTLVCATEATSYLATIVLAVFILIDTILICVFRNGNERTW